MLVEILLTLCFGLAAFFIFIYYVRKGQFDASEEVKYQIFHDDEHKELKNHIETRFKQQSKQTETPSGDAY